MSCGLPAGIGVRKYWRKASKEHACCECGTHILPGEHYIECVGIWEDGPHHYRWCLTCYAIRQMVQDEMHPDDMPSFGELWHWLENLNAQED